MYWTPVGKKVQHSYDSRNLPSLYFKPSCQHPARLTSGVEFSLSKSFITAAGARLISPQIVAENVFRFVQPPCAPFWFVTRNTTLVIFCNWFPPLVWPPQYGRANLESLLMGYFARTRHNTAPPPPQILENKIKQAKKPRRMPPAQ